MTTNHHRGLVALLVAGACSAIAVAEDAETPPKLSADEMSAAALIIPSPGEILGTLKEAESSDWESAAEAHAEAIAPVKEMDSTQAAVLLGRRTAEAFLALEAEDADLLKKASGQILDAARKLGASEGILEKGKEISDKAEAGEWAEVHSLLDAVYVSAQADLKEVEDDDSVTIAAAAGWLTGVAIYAGQVADAYSEEAGKALRQGDLAKTLHEQLTALPEGAKEQASVQALIDAFAKIQPLVAVGQDDTVSEESVKKLAAIANESLAKLN